MYVCVCVCVYRVTLFTGEFGIANEIVPCK
jgi:hypothetical protein